MLEGRSAESHGYSLPEVHGSVVTSHIRPWRRLLAFAGPAYLVSVGYMDPGNWATDLEAGARFGYRLLWVLVLSNAVALLLQTLSARLGIVAGRDLAQACRDEYPRPISYVLWMFSEVAIVACDLAEVLGAAIGLNLLFHIPLLIGVLITAADTLLLLWFTRVGIRTVEAFVLVLIATIAGCFAFEIFLSHANASALIAGLVPRLNSSTVYIAAAIFGATVMPHNLYLHSALVQTRRLGATAEDKRVACHYNLLDSAIALNGALFVNAAILVMAAAVFFTRHIVVTEIQQAHQLLSPLLGTAAASILFGAALLCSGQSSTLTGTMAGQIVMEGFLHFRIQPWLRRAITRLLAITPAALTIYFAGETGSYRLLILSQVILSLQLPFAVIPLVHLTSDRNRMGEFANGMWLKAGSWGCAAFILVLNIWLLGSQLSEWSAANAGHRGLIYASASVVALGFAILLGYISFWPHFRTPPPLSEQVAFPLPEPTTAWVPRTYSTILVSLDHSESDRDAIGNALALAKLHGSQIVLLHVEEGVTSQLFGSQSSTAEIAEGRQYMDQIVSSLHEARVDVKVSVRHGNSPAKEIVAAVRELQPDLVVMASHGHKGIKDLIFGTTINAVRHRVRVPLLIVSGAQNT
ncbi:MAG TPA: Nramp family divalent metal transporter [Bryobacteraceae bacterium]|jgi:manganese transport protein|nr:Nramp family divalent metal transporter [Bryobacteraceae bacterium]